MDASLSKSCILTLSDTYKVTERLLVQAYSYGTNCPLKLEMLLILQLLNQSLKRTFVKFGSLKLLMFWNGLLLLVTGFLHFLKNVLFLYLIQFVQYFGQCRMIYNVHYKYI